MKIAALLLFLAVVGCVVSPEPALAWDWDAGWQAQAPGPDTQTFTHNLPGGDREEVTVPYRPGPSLAPGNAWQPPQPMPPIQVPQMPPPRSWQFQEKFPNYDPWYGSGPR